MLQYSWAGKRAVQKHTLNVQDRQLNYEACVLWSVSRLTVWGGLERQGRGNRSRMCTVTAVWITSLWKSTAQRRQQGAEQIWQQRKLHKSLSSLSTQTKIEQHKGTYSTSYNWRNNGKLSIRLTRWWFLYTQPVWSALSPGSGCTASSSDPSWTLRRWRRSTDSYWSSPGEECWAATETHHRGKKVLSGGSEQTCPHSPPHGLSSHTIRPGNINFPAKLGKPRSDIITVCAQWKCSC